MSSQYDPDNPEGSRPPAASYVTKNDIKWVAIVLVFGTILFWPLWSKWMEDGKKKVCSTNIQLIGKALLSYAELNDNRFPPIYESGDNESPSLIDGVPINWMTLVEPHLSKRGGTVCPSAKPEEHSYFYSVATKKGRALSYGLYFPIAAAPTYQLKDPDRLILLTETTTNGANNTYNPTRLTYSDGSVLKDDGFMIGYDNKDGNFDFKRGETKFVTRLAFGGTANGVFDSEKATARHAAGNHVIFADGSMGFLQPTDAPVKFLDDQTITGRWRTD